MYYLTPTAPTAAFDIGAKSNNPLEMYLADICTVSSKYSRICQEFLFHVGVDKEWHASWNAT